MVQEENWFYVGVILAATTVVMLVSIVVDVDTGVEVWIRVCLCVS